MKILQYRLKICLTTEEAYSLALALTEVLKPLIGGVRRSFWERLNIPIDAASFWPEKPADKASPFLLGDILLSGQDSIFYYKLDPNGKFMEVGALSRKEPQGFEDFRLRIREKLEEISGRPVGDFEELDSYQEVLPLLKETSETILPSRADMAASREIEKPEALRLISTLGSGKEIFLKSLLEGIDNVKAVEAALERFQKVGLAAKDYVILCQKTGQQILRASSGEAVEESLQKGFKCSLCGKPISQERIEELIVISDFGQKMLDRDYWLVVRAFGALETLGITQKEILVERSSAQAPIIFFNLGGRPAVLVLKSAPFTLNDVYIIQAQVAAYGIALAVLVSNAKIPTIIKNNIRQGASACTFGFIENLDGFEEKLQLVLRERLREYIIEITQSFNELTPVRVQDLIINSLTASADEVLQESRNTVEESSEKESHKKKTKKISSSKAN